MMPQRHFACRFMASVTFVAGISLCLIMNLIVGGRSTGRRLRATAVHPCHGTLLAILPRDLDDMSPAPSIGREAFLSAVGAQILLFGGFSPRTGRWMRDAAHPSLTERVRRIEPAWKAGNVEYSMDASGSNGTFPLFRLAMSGGTAVGAGSSVASLAAALESHGLCGEDFDAEAQGVLRTILSWRLPAHQAYVAGAATALLAFSFDATPGCRSLKDCPLPGPSNELIAATVEHFCERSVEPVQVYAQWEIASALLRSGRVPKERIHSAGSPGMYQNTVEILQEMTRDLFTKSVPKSVLVLAHPDHVRRAYHTATTFFSQRQPLLQIVPAMAPYGLDWPTNKSEGTIIDLFEGVTGVVHSQGKELASSWRAVNLGYFPDAEPQKWVHRREVWILYDQWAMAKGVAAGIILPQRSASNEQ